MSKAGDRDVVGTGVIVTHHGDRHVDLTFENLTYRLIFKDGAINTGPNISSEIVEGRLDLTLENFNQPLGTSWFGDVGKISDRNLHLAFMVHAVGEGDKITRSIAYTFTLGRA